MPGETDVANAALLLIGGGRISSLDDGSPTAGKIRDPELVWNRLRAACEPGCKRLKFSRDDGASLVCYRNNFESPARNAPDEATIQVTDDLPNVSTREIELASSTRIRCVTG